ncbi:unnamed protein product [Fraxinus pennsylvanica]|uniref:ABC transporter domain-containing protein n=1 Tax=Fraxinus pennsylvanica TaxID=56036 RepID=A0AAD2AES6_9LAMI|nr:unnamed protein product [Fraxinus pennsylvanica]
MKRSTSSGSLPPPFGAPDLIDYHEAQTGDTRDEREVKEPCRRCFSANFPEHSDGDSRPGDSLHDQLVASHHNPSSSAACWFARIPLDGFYKGFSADAKVMYEEASQVANDAVSSIRTVASFSAEEKIMKMYKEKCEAHVKQGVLIGLTRELVLLHKFLQFLHWICSDSTWESILWGCVLAIGVSQASAMAPDVNEAKDSVASTFEILDSKPEIDSISEEGTTLSSVRGDIEFQHVSFKYPTRPDIQIFKDLCQSMPFGQTMALVGESGSGKFTVISLIQRFYNPDSGQIFLDRVEIRKLKLSWLRQQMGLLSQEPILFNETICENIAHGKTGDGAEEEIISATRAADAHNFISGLPQEYVLTKPFAAHLLTTIMGTDTIAVVKNGVIVEKGSHDVLVKMKDGVYASLVAPHCCSQ